MVKWVNIFCVILVFFSCKNAKEPTNIKDVKNSCSSIVFEKDTSSIQTLFYYSNTGKIDFKPDFKDFDSVKYALNCLNVYDFQCWNDYNNEAITLYNRSTGEPNGWADGPFTKFMPEGLIRQEQQILDAKRNPLKKLNVVRFQLFKDSLKYERVYHIGVDLEPPSNFMVMVDYENLDDMIGEEGNYGIGKGYHIKCKELKKDYFIGANYIVNSTKEPEYKCSGITRCNIEKPVLFTIYDTLGSRMIQQHVGLSLSAGTSINYPVKGLKVTARNSYGQSKMETNVFGKQESYKNMRIRLGGSGQFINPCNQVMDAIGHDIYGNRGMKNQFASLYINGYQWGIGYLQEKFDEHYIGKKYGFNPEFVDVVEVTGLSNGQLLCNDSALSRKLDEKGKLEQYGYHEFISFDDNYCWLATVKDGNGKAFSNFYQEILQGNFNRLDQESFFDYLAHVDLITNHDPGRSSIFFCDDRRDPTWYVQAFDFDKSFADNPEADYWTLILNTTERDVFRDLVKRYFAVNVHRQEFIIHYQDLLNTKYSLNVLLPKIRKRIIEFEKEVSEHEYAWTPYALNAEEWVTNCYDNRLMEDFIMKRHPAVRHYLAQRFMSETGFVLKDQNTIKVKFPKYDLGDDFYIEFNTLELKGDFEGKYYPWPSINLAVKNLPNGYEFIGWKGLEQNNPKTTFLLEKDVVIEPLIRKRNK